MYRPIREMYLYEIRNAQYFKMFYQVVRVLTCHALLLRVLSRIQIQRNVVRALGPISSKNFKCYFFMFNQCHFHSVDNVYLLHGKTEKFVLYY
jgi:surface polysaccharide O-acyltransferase-like enzyme